MSGNSHQRRKKIRSVVIPRVRAVYDSDCGNGIYWCNHVYDEQHPWVWVDFRFPSLKKRNKLYYAVAMRTLEYARVNEIEDSVWDSLDGSGSSSDYEALREIIASKTATDVTLMSPSITLKHYRPGVIGVHCTVNTPYINDRVISDFILLNGP